MKKFKAYLLLVALFPIGLLIFRTNLFKKETEEKFFDYVLGLMDVVDPV